MYILCKTRLTRCFSGPSHPSCLKAQKSCDLQLTPQGNKPFIIKRAPRFRPRNLLLCYLPIYVKPSPIGIAITHREKPACHSLCVRFHYYWHWTGPRRALGIAAQPVKQGYRSDLRAVSVDLELSRSYFILQVVLPLLRLRQRRILIRTHWRRFRASLRMGVDMFAR